MCWKNNKLIKKERSGIVLTHSYQPLKYAFQKLNVDPRITPLEMNGNEEKTDFR